MNGLAKNRDLLFAAGVVACVAVVFVPLPAALMDLLLVFSMAMALITLFAVIYVREPIAFSAFPTILLLSTSYRLALNIATTRLILTGAKTEGTLAAGRVVRSFGEFVASGEPVVGFVIFLIVIIVNFVVISKGATRIGEVAARFTLDALPGRQMAVDAELNAGLITADEARRRRQDLSREAAFYGAMDGATKFVRGDAIAGLVITVINIVGGLVLGTLRHGMDVSTALSTFTILTIGDGLVAAMPALLVSIAAGLMVTRASAETNLGDDVIRQMFLGEKRSLFISAAVLGLLALTAFAGSGMPWFQLLAVAAVLTFVGRGMVTGARRVRAQEAERKEAVRPAERPEGLLHVEPLQIDLGLKLVRVADRIMDRVASLRRELAAELGVVAPSVVVKEGERLEGNQYVIRLRGVPVARGRAFPGEMLAISPGGDLPALDGRGATDPVFGRPATWIDEGASSRARELGYSLVDAPGVVSAHLRETVRDRAAELLTRDDVGFLLKSLKERRPAAVEEVVPALVKPGELQKVLQNLLREGVSIRDLGTILETLGDQASRTKDPEALTEHVRAALGRAISEKHLEPDGKLYVITVDAPVEAAVKAALERTGDGMHPVLPPELQARVGERLAREMDRLVLAGHAPVVLCSSAVRRAVKGIAESIRPGMAVLSYGEISREIQIVSGGVVGA